nr:RNA-directed DNA polymerase, eukaryota, reverse transcriptase zinc-binding domain protein [Tanacetum cinerariifolium]
IRDVLLMLEILSRKFFLKLNLSDHRSILTDLQKTLKTRWRYLVPAESHIHNRMLIPDYQDIKYQDFRYSDELSNLGRQALWHAMQAHKDIANDRPWALMGDFNVTLKTHEHFAGGSFMIEDMIEFNECINKLELEDICSTVSDHSPAVITIPEGLKKIRISFRFVNYIADKEEFAKCVSQGWKLEERQALWHDMQTHKDIANDRPWALMGDFNVTLKTHEHSAGGSFMIEDMIEFNECINKLELEDICSTGF